MSSLVWSLPGGLQIIMPGLSSLFCSRALRLYDLYLSPSSFSEPKLAVLTPNHLIQKVQRTSGEGAEGGKNGEGKMLGICIFNKFLDHTVWTSLEHTFRNPS